MKDATSKTWTTSAEDRDEAYPAGTTVGRYVVVSPIARGGMGEVMLAFDVALARYVALKVTLRSVASPEASGRMLREAQAMARIAHPNVAAVYDVGLHQGQMFVAMEYVNGITLHDWLKTRHSYREAVALMKQAGRGLAAAHEANVIHRDFKPSNVLVTPTGRACVVDFGISRGLDEAPPKQSAGTARTFGLDPEGILDRTLTQPDALMGTIGYSAPEVAMGERGDPRADVFSFSVTLWRVLCGSMPYPSHGLIPYLVALRDTEPVRAPKAAVPAPLRDILLRGVQRDPAARFGSMGELLDAIDLADAKRLHVDRVPRKRATCPAVTRG